MENSTRRSKKRQKGTRDKIAFRSQTPDKWLRCPLTLQSGNCLQGPLSVLQFPLITGPCWLAYLLLPQTLQPRNYVGLPYPSSSGFCMTQPFGCASLLAKATPLDHLLLSPPASPHWHSSVWSYPLYRCLCLWLCSPSYLQLTFFSAIPSSSHVLPFFISGFHSIPSMTHQWLVSSR